MGLPVGGFNDEVGEVSSTFLFAGCFLFFTEEPGFPFCKAAVTMMDGFLQLVACWLAAQTGLFLCCFWGGGGGGRLPCLHCSCSATFAPRLDVFA